MFRRKIKIITLTSFLIIVFTLFLGSWTTVLAVCNEDCGDCLTTVTCNTSDVRCTWYEAKGACFEGLETDWPPAPGGVDLTGESTLLEFIDYVFRWGILLGGLAAFVILILAGFQYLTSVGDPVKMQEARNRIRDAILGLILLLSTFLILNTLNPELTTLVMPSPTPGGFGSGTFGGIGSKAPCKEVKIYGETDWETGSLFAAYIGKNFPDYWNQFWLVDNVPCSQCPGPRCPGLPDPGVNCLIQIPQGICQRIGDAGGWFGVGAINIKMSSVKIVGACVLTLYDDNNCNDSPSNLSTSDKDITAIFTGYKHSIRLTERTPPVPPKVENSPLVVPAQLDSSGVTCQVQLGGNLSDMGGNDYVRVSFRIGKAIDKMMEFPPEESPWMMSSPPWIVSSPPEPFPLPATPPPNPPDYWNTEDGQIFEDPTTFNYIVTGLEAPVVSNLTDEGTIYYWTAKACATQGTCTIADEDPDDPAENYPTTSLKIYDPPGPNPLQCIAM